jgi:hypothetical protein
MAIGTGAVSMSDIRTEWGRSGAIKLSEMYRGGSHVRNKAANNTGTNLASGVPESGVITLDDFRGTTAGFRYTFTATATNQDASDLFGDDYAVNYRKEIVINSGVELGATSTAEEALEIDSGGAGTIVITNNGTLSGAGGAAGADGGDAFEAAVTCTFINNGTVRAGGGGGGTGGNGSSSSDSGYVYGGGNYIFRPSDNDLYYWGGVYKGAGGASIAGNDGATYYRGSKYTTDPNGYNYYYIRRVATVSTTGGSGGVGAGYNQSAGSGAAGGTNAGTGGTGGAFGASGSSGANGNSTNGSSGGAAGKYLRGSSFVTFTNNGTAQGGTA